MVIYETNLKCLVCTFDDTTGSFRRGLRMERDSQGVVDSDPIVRWRKLLLKNIL